LTKFQILNEAFSFSVSKRFLFFLSLVVSLQRELEALPVGVESAYSWLMS
jgi:hypothetical protein